MRHALVAAALALTLTAASHAQPVNLDTLKAGDRSHRFEASTVYLDAAERPLGARFIHRPTGFQLDLLQIESVPQAFTWVKTFATSNQGEPHTQEHLLLLRGVRGRTLSTRQSMSLVAHSAYTESWRTSYVFNTAAGVDAFFDIYAEQQRAMLHPDYSDDEIRLEVRGLQREAGLDGQQRLEGLARTTACGLRHQPCAGLQRGRRAGRHPQHDAAGHPPLCPATQPGGLGVARHTSARRWRATAGRTVFCQPRG